ncbi:MAG: chloride channel protein [Sphingobacteriales bacterium]|nr:chloride channel protein [Sphingobacteriales bacterium]
MKKNAGKKLRTRALRWQRKHLSPNNFLLVLGVVVAFLSGLVDVLVRTAAHKVVAYLSNDFVPNVTPYLFFTLPFMGIIITGFLVRYLNKGYLSKGIPSVMYSVFKNGSRMQKRQMYLQPLTAFTTVGFGGSAGFEGPMVAMGASLAANLGLWWGLTQKHRTILIACAAAAVTSANFKAPITGVIFAVEVLHIELRVATIIPVLFASITGVIVNKWLFGEEILFNFTLTDQFLIQQLPYYLLLGVITGLVSVHFGKANLRLEVWFKSMTSRLNRALIGGGLLGLSIFLFPPLFGEGYYVIKLLMEGKSAETMQNTLYAAYSFNEVALLVFLSGSVLLKTFACSFTSGGGGNGGLWAAFLFTGSLTGYVFAHALNLLPWQLCLPEPAFMLAGMAGLASGVLHAPLTAIFLAAEISNGYDLLIPFMLVSGLSYSITKHFMPYSVFQSALVKKGHWIANDKDKQLLVYLAWTKLIEKNVPTLTITNTLGDIVALIKENNANQFAVINNNNELIGLVSLDDVRPFLFETEQFNNRLVNDIMHPNTEVLHLETDSAEQVMQQFDRTGAWYLPVVSHEEGYFVGFLSKVAIFAAYRQKLIEMNND